MILFCLLSSAVLIYSVYQWRAITIASKNFFWGGNHKMETPTHHHQKGRRGSVSDYESEDGMPSNEGERTTCISKQVPSRIITVKSTILRMMSCTKAASQT